MLGEVADVRAGETKQAGALPKTGEGAVCAQYRRCGKPSCHCAHGTLHGPYFCLFWRERGRLRKRYLRSDEVDAVRASILDRREREQSERERRQIWHTNWRELRAALREVERG